MGGPIDRWALTDPHAIKLYTKPQNKQRELQRGMQGTLACVLLTHAERRMRGIAEGERWRGKG